MKFTCCFRNERVLNLNKRTTLIDMFVTHFTGRNLDESQDLARGEKRGRFWILCQYRNEITYSDWLLRCMLIGRGHVHRFPPKSRRFSIFMQSIAMCAPIQPPIERVAIWFPQEIKNWGLKLTTDLHIMQRLRMNGAILPHPQIPS